MPNPQPYQPTYNYLNADIGALSSVAGIPLSLQNEFNQFFDYENPYWNEGFVLNTTVTSRTFNSPSGANFSSINLLKVFCYTPKSYSFNGNEIITIRNSLNNIVYYNGKLTQLVERNGDNTERAFLFPDLPIRGGEAITFEVSGFGGGLGITIGFNVWNNFKHASKDNNNTQWKGVNTQTLVASNASATALATAVDALCNGLGQRTVFSVSYVFDTTTLTFVAFINLSKVI